MKVFKVYGNEAGEFKAIKIGFTFSGLIFGHIWLWYKGLYVRGALFFFAYVLIGNLIYGMEKDTGFLMNGILGFIPALQHPPLIQNETLRFGVGLTRTLTFGLVIGFFGNYWCALTSLKSGFVHIADVEAPRAQLAIEWARTKIIATSSSVGIRDMKS
jgi:hypothetical protein